MKKILVATVITSLFASSAFAVISGGKHDMTSRDAGTNTEVCVYCHTPHNADNTVTKAPLWNRLQGGTGIAAGFYSSTSLEATTSAQISNASIDATDAPLCLSCHDGTITDSLQNSPNSGTTGAITAITNDALLDLDFSDDHPIGFNYSQAQTTDTQLVLKTTVEGAANMTGAVSYGGGDSMWCSSCHDVHGVTGVSTFLRMNNTGSALCTTCHAK